MSKKNLFQIIVAVACLVGAFMVIYNSGLFGNQQLPNVSFTRQGGSVATKNSGIFSPDVILPFGKLQGSDFDKAFGERRSGMLRTTYPVLDTNKDVKVDVKDLFGGASVSTSTPAQ